MIADEIPALIADRKIVTDEERIYLAPLFMRKKGRQEV